MKKFNLNSSVKVKLNRQGLEQWVKHYTSVGCDEGSVRKNTAIIGKDGYAEIQMWQLMNIFGSEMYAGNSENNTMPFESIDVLFNEADLRDVQMEKLKKAVPTKTNQQKTR